MLANRILILAESGSGKSTSLRNLDPKETFIINCLSKPLPFRGWKGKYNELTKESPNGNLYNSSNGTNVLAMMKHVNDKRPDIKTLIIDDFNYISAYKLFDRAKDSGFNKFVDVALEIKTLATAPEFFRDDLIVIYMMHPDVSLDIEGNKIVKPKIGGKMIENQLTFEGLFDKVLYGKVIISKTTKEAEFGFETKKTTDLSSPAKTPMDLFTEAFIPNDLQLVLDAVKRYEN